MQNFNDRRRLLSESLKIDLKNISNPVFDTAIVSTKNCENLIGKTEIPLGVAGPLKIKGKYANGEFYIPLATTEGALVASINRGCKAVRESGGADVFIEKFGVTRAVVFATESVIKSKKFVDWINKNINLLAKKAQESGRFVKLMSVSPTIAGGNAFLRLNFYTGDAMGMNMVTIACDSLVDFIEKKTKFKCISLSANLCVDKKPAWINKIEGRGYSTHAGVLIPQKVIKEVLKTNADRLDFIFRSKIMLGSALAGSIGFNAHHANIIAAIFLATGQDPAHVVEGSLGTTTVEKTYNGGVYVSVSLPSLMLGTIGGGTELPTQKEALSILGVVGGGNPAGTNAKKFAEIVTVAVLAGELSLISALASNDLAKSHKKLGRGQNV